MKLVDLPSETVMCRNLVAGAWRAGVGASRPVRSPYTGQVIGQVPLSTAAEVDEAVKAAAAAFDGWRRTPIKERCQVLFRFRQLMLEQLEPLSHRAAAEAGKTVAEARAGIAKGLEVVEFATSLQNLEAGAALEVSRGVTCQASREPLGVVAGITPFNFPAMVPLWMYPIALALGNCFVLKPSEKVPLTSQLVAGLLLEAGVPPGVFSLVNGDERAVNALIDHPAVQAVAFVGSTPVAQTVYARATAQHKRALALGGAKNLVLLAPDADPEVAVRGILDSFTGCAGQRCMAASLLVAVGEVEPLLARVTEAARRLALGGGMGAIIDRPALERIEAIIGRAEASGARLLLDGRRPRPPVGYEGGYWLAPTIIDQARPGMECVESEIFGPVLTVVRVATLAEAMDLENNNPFGNATSVFTTSGAVARYVTERATNGMIGVNIGVPVPREPFSFGGTKASKFGACDVTGPSAVEFWTSLKKVTTKWTMQADHNWMS